MSEEFCVAMTISGNEKRPEPQALASTIEALAARFGNRLITSQAVRDQHAHTTTCRAPQPPDAGVMAQQPSDIQGGVRICARHSVPVIALRTGTSLEGQINAPSGGAEGRLGIICELTIKLRGIPETIAAAACSFESVRGACQATILAIQTGIPVARIELLNAAQVRACNSYSKLSLPETPLLLLEFHGSANDVAEQSRNFSEIAKECGGGDFTWTTRPEDRTKLWQARHH